VAAFNVSVLSDFAYNETNYVDPTDKCRFSSCLPDHSQGFSLLSASIEDPVHFSSMTLTPRS
jgi:hypothetical protein